MPLDQFNGLDDAHTEASQLIERMPNGWIVDGCVWQVPPSVWALADVAVHLTNFSNALHYAASSGARYVDASLRDGGQSSASL